MNETAKERTDRQLQELLNELRVALPGAQVLLGFLLTAPFASRFGRTSQGERIVLFTCTMFTAAGVLLLMAPSIYHRIRWNQGGKQDVIRVGHFLFLIGTGCLALGMFCALFLIGYMLFGTVAAVAAIAVAASIVASVWYVLPLRRGRDPSFRREE